jgi:hypothetical protein
VEVLVGTLIVGGMVVAALNSVGAVYRSQRLNAWRQVAPSIAHEMMGEILSLPYEDPEDGAGTIGLDVGESSTSRGDFDDCDDYHGYGELGAESKTGSPLDGYANWQRSVTVNWARLDDATTTLVSDTGLKRITVTVTDPDGVQTQIVGLRWKDGALQQAPPVDTNVVTWIGAELRIGNSPFVARSGTQLNNHVSDGN